MEQMLNSGGPRGPMVLRDPRGEDEQSTTGTATVDALRLVGRLLVADLPGAATRDDLWGLDPWRLDRLLADLYRRIHGRRIVASLRCEHCRRPFDLDFDLDALVAHLAPTAVPADIEAAADGTWRLADGTRFRLPEGRDALAVCGLSAQDAARMLIGRCVLEPPGGEGLDPERIANVERAMETLAPIVDTDLDARCPECGESRQVHFDLQHYLLAGILAERPRLMAEIHTLASAYGWGLQEILGLPRGQRRALVGLVEAGTGGWS